MKKTLLFILLFELLIFNFSFSNTHYVSKTGSSIPPYDSWETAADSIQKGIDVASSGDTVRVGPGTYYETVVMIQGIALIGAGMDSTIIDGSKSTVGDVVTGSDSGTIEGFYIKGRYPGGQFCLGIYNSVGGNTLKYIRNNKLSNCHLGTQGARGTEISNNVIIDNWTGVEGGWGALIMSNTITHNGRGINLFLSSDCRIAKNIISYSGIGIPIFGYVMDSLFIQNNLITDLTSQFIGSSAMYLSDGQSSRARIINNTITVEKKYQGITISNIDADIRNNIIANGSYGVRADSPSCYVTASYNDLWNNTQNYSTSSGAIIDTSLGGNIYSDPMFVGNGDYHLQKYSPCIDAGDPNIKDPDSSRSDIGCYGGLYGETYTYLDLPPKAPDSLDASFDSIAITLAWKPNTEADLSHYLVYKDTVFNFIPDTFKIVGIVSKDSSSFRDYNWEYGKTYYYKLSAYDLTNHQSPYSDELMIKATDVPWIEEIKVEIDKYSLSQNYPNPFNPTTVIVYYLPDIGFQPAEVELTIYNVLGKKVRTLVKERQHLGEHRAVWDGKDDDGNDVASGIYFYRLKVSGVDFVKAKKMTLIR